MVREKGGNGRAEAVCSLDMDNAAPAPEPSGLCRRLHALALINVWP